MNIWNKLMKTGAFLLLVSISHAAFGNIMMPGARSEAIQGVEALLDAEVRTVSSEDLATAPSPFDPYLGFEPKAPVVEEVVIPDVELIDVLAAYIKPTGTFIVGGEYYLFLKDRKLRVGSEMKIEHEKRIYTITVLDITNSSFKIQHGDAFKTIKLK